MQTKGVRTNQTRRTRSVVRSLMIGALTLALTGCLLRFFSGLVIVDDLGMFIDLIFEDVSAGYCRDVEDFETGTTSVECIYNIVTEDGSSQRTSTAELISNFGFFGIVVDPVILQVPDIATIVAATVDDGSGPQNLVVTETTSFDITPSRQANAELGQKFWIIDLPPSIEANLPEAPAQTDLDYRFSYRLPGVFSTDPVTVKAMYAGRVETGGETYYLPMLPCTDDFSAVPELSLPVGVPLNGFIFNLLNLFLSDPLTCNQEVYDFTDGVAQPPEARLLKQVSLDGANFFDADQPGDPDVPIGIAGSTDATYRLIVQNTGLEALTNVLLEDPTLGISTSIADLAPGEIRVIGAGDAGFGNLFQPDRCVGPAGNRSNIASVEATGAVSGISTTTDDPANVRCIAGPAIRLLKQVSLDGVNFLDADTAATAPTASLGADATYRLIVRNTGDEGLSGVSVDDPTLGIAGAGVPDLPVGAEVVIDAGSFGAFAELFVGNRCASVGTKVNIAKALGTGALSGAPVEDDDSAFVNCADARIRLLKQVSLDAVNFFDADQPGDPDVPVGIAGSTAASYRLIVENVGLETLTDVLLEDPTLGISSFIADLAPNETRVIGAGDAGFANLFQPDRCSGQAGNRSNIASVSATGTASETLTTTDDPANVRCIVGPAIQLLKQVSLDGVNYLDADTTATGPTASLGADATYRLIVRNTGDEDLGTISVDDPTLGIAGAGVPDLPVGAEVVIDAGSFGAFDQLFVANRCDSVGTKINIAKVLGSGRLSGAPVEDDDSANVNCTSACVDDLAARAKSGEIQLTWAHTGASSYNVYRAQVSGGPYQLIANTASTYSTYLDTNVTNGSTYHYVIGPLDISGNEVCVSNEASATPSSRRRR